jgi:hypothetical protein
MSDQVGLVASAITIADFLWLVCQLKPLLVGVDKELQELQVSSSAVLK